MDLMKIWEQAKAFWLAQSTARRVVLVVLSGLVLAGSAALTMYEPAVDFRTVASNLSEQDAAAIVQLLETDKVTHRIQDEDGMLRVQVPAAVVDQVRMSLASGGVKTGGFGFPEFIDAPPTVSSSREGKLYTIALSREISRIIAGMDSVRKAEVVLTTPKKSLYRGSEAKPTASVVVHLVRGRTLSTGEIRGIVSLVAGSVDGLDTSAVTLVDRSGQQLWTGGDEARVSSVQRDKEGEIREKIRKLLTQALGPEQFHVEVTTTYERSERYEESEVYETTDKSVISTQISEENRPGGVVRQGLAGARANSALTQPADPTLAPAPTSSSVPSRRSETKNLQPSRVTKRTSETTPRLVRVDVGVMVNRTPPVVTRTSTAGTSSTAGYLAGSEVQLGPVHRQPDLVELSRLIRAAGGLDFSRGDTLELIPVELWRPEELPVEPPAVVPEPWYLTLPMWTYGAAAGVVVLLFVGFLVAIRRHNQQNAKAQADLLAFPTRADEMQAALDGSDYEPEPTLAELRSKVHELLGNNADLGAEILSAWINEGRQGDTGRLEEAA